MSAALRSIEPGRPAAAPAGGRRDLLRFITCGSVDDGKSTLIGRLLHDTGQLLDDQLSALARDSLRSGTQDGALDLALALDGLAAEREQGITIDVAYRFFATERRAFIVADTPGHVEYTRNMATGASTADAAVLLVDARKGLSLQTRRHTLLVATLGIRDVVVAVNKMDLVDWSESVFAGITEEYRSFAAELGFRSVVAIPLSAKSGDNVTRRSPKAPWFDGPDLLSQLERIDAGEAGSGGPFRFPVQWVNRPNAEFRGVSGLLSGGRLLRGQRVTVLPSGEETSVARIVTFDGDLAEARPGQSVTLVLADDVDASRGCVITPAGAPARVAGRIDARVFWMAKTPLAAGSRFLVKLGTQTVPAEISRVVARVDLQTLAPSAAEALAANDVGDVAVTFDRPVVADPYAANRDTGSFILIDPESFDTVGMGLVLPEEQGSSREFASEGATAAPAPSAGAPRWLPAPFAAPWRSALKAASWRVTGTMITVAAALGLTGDLHLATLLGLIELVVKFALQFCHERIWTRIGLGLRSSTAPPRRLQILKG